MSITIKWSYSTEYLDIDPDHLDANSIEKIEKTKEWWPSTRKWYPGEGVFVCWRVECSLEECDGGKRITVRYTQGQQDDENILECIEDESSVQAWVGKTRIIVTEDSTTDGECEWICEDPDWSGSSRWKAMGRPRLRVTREQWQRESRFRKAVLAEDAKCVISGEATPEVLDAAHLRPVKEGGEERVENGFILRTDIHRLYDRGMFLISPKDGTITINGRNLPKDYKQLFCQSQLPQETLNRVREALQERCEKPWS